MEEFLQMEEHSTGIKGGQAVCFDELSAEDTLIAEKTEALAELLSSQDNQKTTDIQFKLDQMIMKVSQMAVDSSHSAPKCEVCDSLGVENISHIHCQNCQAFLCFSHDAETHPPINPILSRHIRESALNYVSYTCPFHPEETASYFCLECESHPVCAECIIHGAHQGHEALSLKKSLPIVQDRLKQLATFLSTCVSEVEMMIEKAKLHKTELVESTVAIKKSMQRSFQELHDKLHRKESDLLSAADSFAEQQISNLSHYADNASKKVKMVSNVVDDLLVNASTADASLCLAYYANNRNTLATLTESKDLFSEELPALAPRKVYLDTDAAAEQVESINGLHLVIAQLEPQEPTPQRSNKNTPIPQALKRDFRLSRR
eukprot:TRINITY_DN282_c0_g1_i14.p1 TRINITY_DN282_c0_g1~~TRINITY_DN282_c0_g1_i14.p1  ORF type:complete len:389 (-),score=34.75 TRINITY_DN282_c0_g1_i14:28-1152(-)